MAQEEEEQKLCQNLNIVNTIEGNKKTSQSWSLLGIPNLKVISVTCLVQLNHNLIDTRTRLEQLLHVTVPVMPP